MQGGGYGEFCRSAQVLTKGIWRRRLPLFGARSRQGLSTEQTPAQCRQRAGPKQITLTHLCRNRWHREPDGQLIFIDEPRRRQKIDQRHGIDTCARLPRHEQVEYGKIKCLVEGLREAVPAPELIAD